jgi:Fe-S-cluster containining protein
MSKSPRICLVSEAGSSAPAPGCVRLRSTLHFPRKDISLVADVPDKRMRLADLVPLAIEISDLLRPLAVEQAVAEGKTIPCSKGCDACCRRLMISILPAEAAYLIDVVRDLPTNPRQAVLKKFDAAAKKIAGSRMRAHTSQMNVSDAQQTKEFEKNLAPLWAEAVSDCPFLVDHACSIYENRPIVCRDYMVTSPAENCLNYHAQRLPMFVAVADALKSVSAQLEGQEQGQTVVMLQLFAWHSFNQSRAQRTWRGPDMVKKFFKELEKLCQSVDANP